MRKLICLTLLTVLLAGCNKQESTWFTGIEAGTVKAGVFTTDNGKTMPIDGNEGGFDIRTARRVLVSYQTHPFVDPDEVTIDLRGLWDAVIPEPLPEEEVPAEAADGPVNISEAWFNAGYLNLMAVHAGEPAFTASYTVSSNGITIRLRLDGTAGEAGAGSFLSIPMMGAVQAYDRFCASLGQALADSIPVRLVWSWYAQEGDSLTDQVILYEKEGTFHLPH